MKKSISIWSFPATLAFTDKLQLAREAGFEGFEIDLSDDGPLTLNSSLKEVAAICLLAERNGVQLSGLATGLYWGANPASDDPAIRSHAEAILKKQIEIAHVLGLDAILVVPATVGAD